MTWDGGELAEDLATTLRLGREYLSVWTEVPTIGMADDAVGRMDVFAMRPRWGGIHDTRCYEVKVNRRDFFNDVHAHKFTKYLNYARRFYWAVPSGLVTKAEVPPGCGLIVRANKGLGWRTLVQPVMRDVQPTAEFLIGLLNHQSHVEREQRRLRDRITAEENVPLSFAARRIGEDIRATLAMAERGGPTLTAEERDRRYYADDLMAAMEEMWREAGHDDPLLRSHVSPRELARAAAGMMRDARGLREVARYLQTITYVHEGDGAALLRKLGS